MQSITILELAHQAATPFVTALAAMFERFPAVMLLELPLTLLVLAGAMRRFARLRSRRHVRDPRYMPAVSCLITCYSEGRDVQQTLRSLCEQTYPGSIELIPVVDGAVANVATLQAVRTFRIPSGMAGIRRLRPIAKWQRGGRVSSLNAGLAHANGEIVMALDGDTSFDNDMVSVIVREFADPQVPAVSGSLRVRNAANGWVTRLQALEYLLSIHLAKAGLGEWSLVNNVSGAFGAFRRDFLRQIGGWNTHTAEDLDLTLRIKSYRGRRALHIPFAADAIGHTDAPTTLRQFLNQRLRWDGDLCFLYLRKHWHSLHPRLLGWPNFLMTLITGLLFQLVLPFLIMAYLLTAVATQPVHESLALMGLMYVFYLGLTLAMYAAMLLLVSERPRQDLRLALAVPAFPLFMMLQRLWSVVAILNELLRRGHEETSMAPWWVLKKATRF